MGKPIILINPFCSQNYLYSRLQELGYNPTGFTTLKDSNTKLFCKDMNENVSTLSGNMVDDINKIQSFCGESPLTLICLESMYHYSEQLINKLFSGITNDPNGFGLRCDKYIIQQKLKENGKPSINHIKVKRMDYNSQMERIILFYHENNKNIIIKPCSESAATVGVIIPKNTDDILHYSAKGLFGDADTLIESNISGKEYYINVASYNGKHYVSSIGFAHKYLYGSTMKNIYKECIDPYTELYVKINNYILDALDILEVKLGLYTIEVKIDQGNLYLIDFNPRLSGSYGMLSKMAIRHTGYDQIQLLTSAFENKDYAMPIIQNVSGKTHRMLYLHNIDLKKHPLFLSLIKESKSYVDHLIIKLSSRGSSILTLLDVSIVVLIESQEIEELDYETEKFIGLEEL